MPEPETIIRAENLGKKYVIRHNAKKRADTFRDALMNGVRSLGRRLRRPLATNGNGAREDFWALKDVDFEIKRGQVVGIIGRNGAGKSTLLKILSRITEPTTGRVTIDGRVASLLEIGTGFHSELSGRENIYLNGAVLGMTRAEIARKFDEIVAFAEVNKFIDTPVKHYSSGMQTRLAFAVAAHLEPEILIVDEVLAVGDVEFQKRCLSKMEEAGTQGRTVLLVSHNVPMIIRLCNYAILLNQGRLLDFGKPEDITRQYYGPQQASNAEYVWSSLSRLAGDSVAKLHSVRILTPDGQTCETVNVSEPVIIEIRYWNLLSNRRPTMAFRLVNQDGVELFQSNDFCNQNWWMKTTRHLGLICGRCTIPGNLLAEGRISVMVALCSYDPHELHALERDVVSFYVIDRNQDASVRGPYSGAWPGVVRPLLHWEIQEGN